MYVTHYTLWLDQNYSGVVTKAKNQKPLRVTTTDVADLFQVFQLTSMPSASWNTFRDFVLQEGPDVREYH